MAEPASSEPSDEQALAQQLERTEADLRALGEQVGAVPPGAGRVYSVRRARVTFGIVVVLAGLVAWFVWAHWHSLVPALAPLVWIFWRGWRYQHARSRTPGAEDTSV